MIGDGRLYRARAAALTVWASPFLFYFPPGARLTIRGFCATLGGVSHSRLPYSVRKFLRREKSRIRRDSLNPQEAEQRIFELVAKVRGQYDKSSSERNGSADTRNA